MAPTPVTRTRQRRACYRAGQFLSYDRDAACGTYSVTVPVTWLRFSSIRSRSRSSPASVLPAFQSSAAGPPLPAPVRRRVADGLLALPADVADVALARPGAGRYVALALPAVDQCVEAVHFAAGRRVARGRPGAGRYVALALPVDDHCAQPGRRAGRDHPVDGRRAGNDDHPGARHPRRVRAW